MPTRVKTLDPLLSNRIINHLIFWVVIVFLTSYHGSLFGGDFYENFINMLVLLPVQIVAAYILVYWQIPKWFFKGHWLMFLLSIVLAVYVSSVIGRWLFIYVAEPLNSIEGIDESIWEIVTDPLYLLKVYSVIIYLPAILFFFIKMTKERFAHETRISTLMEEKRRSELSFLKAQMNPHFLFNTLNNIYSLAQSKAEQTPEMIMKLSEILDYTIYECNSDRVPFNREWDLIENYVDLEALRYSKEVDLVIHKEVEDDRVMIAPLILISVVENAFKYGLKGSNSTPMIKISAKIDKGRLEFIVENSKNIDEVIMGDQAQLERSEKKGIGVKSVARQLSLQYPDQHTIKIDDSKDMYKVHLTIEL